MEQKLRSLFEFQIFEQNTDLQSVIDSVHARFKARMLSDDEADQVAAAGMPGTAEKRKDPFKDEHERS